jgi:CheY-like chemotaxis protein
MPGSKEPFKILIVDDEEQIIDILRMNLEKRGYACEWAYNGKEALGKIIATSPDLLITDIKMPRMDGLELIERIKKEGIELPVVVITAFFDIDNAIKALRLGAVNFFKKPFDFQSIYDTVFKIEKLKLGMAERQRALDYFDGGHLRFVIPSNIELIDGVSGYIAERAADLGIVPKKQKFYTQLAIDEALSNAILHGNLSIKTKYSEGDKSGTRDDIYIERLSHPEFAAKKVFVDATVNRDMLEVVIEDEGPGFNHGELPDPTDSENVFRYHGRGIFVIKNIMDEVRYNEQGNRITLIKYRER